MGWQRIAILGRAKLARPIPGNVRWTWSDSVEWTWSGHPGFEGVLWQGRWTWYTLSKWTWSTQSQEELVSWQGTDIRGKVMWSRSGQSYGRTYELAKDRHTRKGEVDLVR